MVKRRGIGATSASAVIFSVLLISNLALYVASQNREAMYRQSDAEDSLGDGEAAMAGASGADMLAHAQAFLGSETFDCPTAPVAVAAEVGALSDLQRVGNLTVSTSAEMAPGVQAGDNLSMLAPFNGSVSGDLDIALRVVATGEDRAAGVTLGKTETHLVHLPARLQAEYRDCTGAVVSLIDILSAALPYNCTATPVGPLVESASRASASAVAGDGFLFGLSYALTETIPCTVVFVVSVEQQDIQGPAGGFSVRMQEEGRASSGQQASPSQG